MLEQSFQPRISLAKGVSVTLASQSVDLANTGLNQIRIANSSTGAVYVRFGTTAAALTASATDGEGMLILPGSEPVFSVKSGQNRFAAIGLIANGVIHFTIYKW
jgi:hypothetical protein